MILYFKEIINQLKLLNPLLLSLTALICILSLLIYLNKKEIKEEFTTFCSYIKRRSYLLMEIIGCMICFLFLIKPVYLTIPETFSMLISSLTIENIMWSSLIIIMISVVLSVYKLLIDELRLIHSSVADLDVDLHIYHHIDKHAKHSIFINFLQNNAIFIGLFRFYITYILIVRSFFMGDNAIGPKIVFWLVPLSACTFQAINYFYNIGTYAHWLHITFLINIGINLIIYDIIGNRIAQYLSEEPEHWVSQTMRPVFTRKTWYTQQIIRGGTGSFKTIISTIVGKTTMTSTGRATITVGIISGTLFLYNEKINRDHLSAENAIARDFQNNQAIQARNFESSEAIQARNFESSEAIKARNFEYFKIKHEAWTNSSSKENEPKWEEILTSPSEVIEPSSIIEPSIIIPVLPIEPSIIIPVLPIVLLYTLGKYLYNKYTANSKSDTTSSVGKKRQNNENNENNENNK